MVKLSPSIAVPLNFSVPAFRRYPVSGLMVRVTVPPAGARAVAAREAAKRRGRGGKRGDVFLHRARFRRKGPQEIQPAAAGDLARKRRNLTGAFHQAVFYLRGEHTGVRGQHKGRRARHMGGRHGRARQHGVCAKGRSTEYFVARRRDMDQIRTVI